MTHQYMTEQEIRAAEQRCQQATPGEWVRWEEHSEVFVQQPDGKRENEPFCINGNRICECDPNDLPDFDGEMADDEDAYRIQAEHNSDFIAHARKDLPDALSDLRELRRVVRELSGFAKHEPSCVADLGKPCDCGLSELLALAQQVEGGK